MKISNHIIFYSLFNKEVFRFLKVYQQTIISPIISGVLFYLVFVLALGKVDAFVGNIPYSLFVGSGIVAMTMMQQSFSNSSSSVTLSKINGTFTDYLMTPIKEHIFILAFTCSASLRGLIIGCIMMLIMKYSLNFEMQNFFVFAWSILITNALLALFGIIAGFSSNSIEQMTAFSTYFITPFSFLSGTFYSVKILPKMIQSINTINPFFYIIDLFRFSITGHNEADILYGSFYLIATFLCLYLVAYTMMKSGYKIKS